MIELGKQYRTRDGREVRIYAVDGHVDYPVHGAIKFDGGYGSATWTVTGKISCCDEHPYDLIEIRQRAIDRIEEWVTRNSRLYSGRTGDAFQYVRVDELLSVIVQFKAEEDAQ